MHRFTFEKYRKHFKKGLLNGLDSLPTAIKISLGIWFILLIVSLIFSIISQSLKVRFVFSLIPAFASVLLNVVSTRYNKKNLEIRMQEEKRHICELKRWLKEDMNICNTNRIERLRDRIQSEADRREKNVDNMKDAFINIFQSICFPIVIAAFTCFLELNDNDFFNNVILGILVIGYILIIMAVVFYSLYCIVTNTSKNQMNNYRAFAIELDDVLDLYNEENNNAV